jgi:hypothetical protein
VRAGERLIICPCVNTGGAMDAIFNQIFNQIFNKDDKDKHPQTGSRLLKTARQHLYGLPPNNPFVARSSAI